MDTNKQKSQLQKAPKRCPFLVAQPEYTTDFCLEGDCAWWVLEECAIVAIGRQINYLQHKVN